MHEEKTFSHLFKLSNILFSYNFLFGKFRKEFFEVFVLDVIQLPQKSSTLGEKCSFAKSYRRTRGLSWTFEIEQIFFFLSFIKKI
jgi:hypothetical protein